MRFPQEARQVLPFPWDLSLPWRFLSLGAAERFQREPQGELFPLGEPGTEPFLTEIERNPNTVPVTMEPFLFHAGASMPKMVRHPQKSEVKAGFEGASPREAILVIEDEEDILELVRLNLNRAGYLVYGATRGEEGLRLLRREPIGLVVLDLMLPGISGFDLLKQLRASREWQRLPVLILSARGEESDIVVGLELGADDYMTKPFSPRVLVARVRNLLKRNQYEPRSPEEPLRVGEVYLHPGKHEVRVKGRRLSLTPTEFSILKLLMGKPGYVFTRGQILEAIRGGEEPVTERLVDLFIHELRKKLKGVPGFLETVRGIGYRCVEGEEA